MVSLKKARTLLGELPKDVEEDPYYQKEFLKILDYDISRHGEEWVKEHARMRLSAWDSVRTLL